jgi:glycosyltransferase involved in cell wall biosynthesis
MQAYNAFVEGNLEVIVPVHNISNRRANLSKLLSMDPRIKIDFIVVSDSTNSDDHSEVSGIVKGSLNPKTKVVRGNFGSPGLARNAGLSVATSRWVAFLDSDDEIDLNALELLISNAECKSAQLAIGGITFASQKSQKRMNYYLNDRISVLANLALTPAFTRMVFQRHLISKTFFLDFRMAEDQCFVFDVLAQNPRIHFEEIYFYTYLLGGVGQTTINRSALLELPMAISYINSRIKRSTPDLRQMAVTMIIRQSATFLISVGLNPSKALFRILRILASLAVHHPIRTVRAIALILMYRPRSFV